MQENPHRSASGDPMNSWTGHPNHAVQFCVDRAELLATVTAFASQGLDEGDSVVLVATPAHLRELADALASMRENRANGSRRARLTMLDASAALDAFMVGGVPDAQRLATLVEPCLEAARSASSSSRVRVFGEMVDVLWTRGNRGATIQLERLWRDVVGRRPWCTLLCAYLLDGFASADGLRADQKTCRFAELERRARVLEREIERRRIAEAERVQLLAAERRARSELALLYRLSDAANRAETLEQVYEAALDGIASALGVERASILLFDSDGVMRFKAWRGLSAEYRAAVEGHSPWRPDEKRQPAPVLVDDVRGQASLAEFLPVFERERVRALGFFPLFSRRRLKGKFMVYYPRPHAFSDDERRLAGAVADQIAFAISRTLATRERDRFLGIVGHDLRNPLSAVAMSAAALARAGLDEPHERLVSRIVTSTRRMDELIAELLDFARAREATSFPIQRRPADLAEVARHVVEELRAAHPDITLTLRVEARADGEWDTDRMAQVLSNLAANAIHHGAGGAVDVSIGAEGDAVVLRVHNDGVPIAAGELPTIFDPFRRGNSTAADNEHLGLGLFISREVVRAHGGSIDVSSSAADGTIFTVRLPRAT
jgi:signal transduction histidine kinase